MLIRVSRPQFLEFVNKTDSIRELSEVEDINLGQIVHPYAVGHKVVAKEVWTFIHDGMLISSTAYYIEE